MNTERLLNLVVVVEPDPDWEALAVEQLTRRLRDEVAELDVESVRFASAEALPVGAKGTDAVTLGALLVALSASGGVFVALIQTLRDWLMRQSARHRVAVTIDGDTIELEGATVAQQEALLNAYIQRHTNSSAE